MVVPLALGFRHLLFANWPVDVATLDAHLPSALDVDEYDGTGWLSVVPFRAVHVRPRGIPSWAGIALPELNLRTYVTHEGSPGVYFFSLDAGSVLSVLGARLTHHLPYYYARMEFETGVDAVSGTDSIGPERVRISSRRRHPGERPVRFTASYGPVGEAFEPEHGSLAAFLTERRRQYAQSQDGALRYTDLNHDRWTLYRAEATFEENTLFEANGFDQPADDPTLYYSPGLDAVTSRSKSWSNAR